MLTCCRHYFVSFAAEGLAGNCTAFALEILAGLFLGIGLILDAITRFHLESQARMQEILARVESNERQS